MVTGVCCGFVSLVPEWHGPAPFMVPIVVTWWVLIGTTESRQTFHTLRPRTLPNNQKSFYVMTFQSNDFFHKGLIKWLSNLFEFVHLGLNKSASVHVKAWPEHGTSHYVNV